MIHQAATKFARATQTDAAGDDERSPDRQRGMWSFLTWSFFLAQAVAAHEALAAGRGLQDGSDLDSKGASDDTSAAGTSTPPPLIGSMGGDSGYFPDAKLAAAVAAAGAVNAPQLLASLEAADAVQSALAGDAAANAALESDGTVANSSANTDTAPSDVASEAPPTGSTIVLPVDVAVDLGLELNSDPVLGLNLGGNGAGISINLGNAPIVGLVATDGSIDIDVGLGSTPILGLDLDLGGSGPLLALDLPGVGLDLNLHDGPIVSASLLGLDLDLGAGGLPDLLGATDLSSLTPVLQTVATLTGLPSQVLDLPVVSDLTSTALDAVGNTVQTATTIVDSTFDVVGADSLVASAGDILYPITAALPLNDLFVNGGYTDYSVELQTAPVQLPLDVTASASAVVDAIVHSDIAFDTGAGDDAHSTFSLSSVVESLNLRGLGDGFA